MPQPTSEIEVARVEYDRGRFRSSLETLRKVARKDADSNVLLAETMRHLGELEEAENLARPLTRHGRTDIVTRALIVVAEVSCLRSGVARALPTLKKAVQIALSSGNLELACHARLRLFAQLVGFGGGSVEPNFVDDLRKDLLRAGNPNLLSEYHVLASNHEVARGSLALAAAHVLLARSHLRSHPNPWLEAVVLLAEGGRAFVESEVRQAVAFAKAASALAITSGDHWAQLAAVGSLGHLLVYSGEIAAARKALIDAERLARGLPLAEFAVLETSSQLALLEGDLDECRHLLQRAQEYIARLEGLRGSSYGLSILQTHARLEAWCGRWAEVQRIAEEGLALATQAGDPLCQAQFCAALAHGLTELGQLDAAIASLQQGLDAFLFPPPAIRAELDRALAAILHRQGHTPDARRLLHEARHTAASIGNAILSREIAATEQRIASEAPAAQSVPAPPLALVALLDAADRPDVLGRLLFEHLAAMVPDLPIAICRHNTGVVDVIDTKGWPEPQVRAALGETDGPQTTIPLGENSTGGYSLLAGRPSSLDASRSLLDVRKVVAAALALQQAKAESKKSQSIWSDRDFVVASGAIYLAPPMLDVLKDARRVAPINVPVLLTGETGVGKEVVARLVHEASNRAAKPFIPFNCGAVPREMLESQLFGYRRGAFTGAHESFSGIIRAATGGTVFLDEIGDVPAEIQPKLLRFLESGEVHPLGEPAPTKVDVRIIAATNRPLEAAVAKGGFREDLYYRLNVVPLRIPPLRERREEIPALANQFLRRYADEFNRGALTMTPETVEYLATYSWPGNVRQLLNEMRRIAALAEADSAITPRMLSADITKDRTVEVPRPEEPRLAIGIQLDQPLPIAVTALEKALIERALERTHGRMEDAAKLLGISRKGLFLKRRRLVPRGPASRGST